MSSFSREEHSRAPRSQPVYPWSAHSPPFGQSPSPFPRRSHALSTSATPAGELYLFGGFVHGSETLSNDLYVISTRDFSTTLLQTSGDVPSPRFGHRAVLTSTTLLIWGGVVEFDYEDEQNWKYDDSFYLLNLVSREWTRIVVHGPRPGSRYYYTLTLVGTKLFVFGGGTAKRHLNDIWALDLNSLKSNPFWQSYEPAPGNEKPLPRTSHVSATTGDRIIIFGGYGGPCNVFNDTWSFNVSTRKWTELQCTGSIPSPRSGHAAVLIGDVMYVFGGIAPDGTILGDLAALNLTTQLWTAFKDIGSSPCGKRAHTMASDGGRVFVLGGELSPGAQVDEAKLIHVLDTKLLIYPKPDSNTIRHSEKTTDAGAAHGVLPFQRATSQDMDLSASPQITRERNTSPPSRPAGASGRPRRVPGEETARSEDTRLIELERELSGTLVAKTERDRRIAQLTDDLAQKSALLEQAEKEKEGARLELRELQVKLDESLQSRDHALKQAEENTAEEKERAGLELRKLQAKFDESLLSRDRALQQAEANAGEERKRAGLELRKLQAKLVALDESLLSRDHALQQAEANAGEERERAGLKLRELQAQLDESLLSHDCALEQAKADAAEERERAGQELRELQAKLVALDKSLSRDHELEQAEANAAKERERAGLELQAKLDESLLSCDHALEQAQTALQKSSYAAEVNQKSQRELEEMRAELEAKMSESARALRLRLADMDGCAQSKAEADTYRAQTATGLVNTDELLERVQALVADMISFQCAVERERL